MPKQDLIRRIDLDRMWTLASLTKLIKNLIHPHHTKHEAGGTDRIVLYFNDLGDVDADGPDDKSVPTYDKDTETWKAESGARYGQAFFQMVGLSVATIPGPTNLTGRALTIQTVQVKTDGRVIGTVTAAGGFDFPAGGGVALYENLNYYWAEGSALSMSASFIGTDGTYLSADVYFEVG
jgi:hypothetical protein